MLPSYKDEPQPPGTRPALPPFRVLLADDNGDFLQSVEAYLGQFKDFTVIGRARSGKEAIELVAALAPHVVLVDVAMPDLNGFEVSRRLRTLPAPPRIVILSLYHQRTYHDVARLVGADRFVPKNAIGTELIPVLRDLFGRSPSAYRHGS